MLLNQDKQLMVNMTLLTQQFTRNQQTQTFTLTGIHIHQYKGRKQQLTKETV